MINFSKQITPNTYIEWLDENQVVFFTLQGSNPQKDIDLFTQTVCDVMGEWSPQKPLRVGFFLSSEGAFNSHVRERSSDIYACFCPYMSGRVAVVVPRSSMGEFVVTYIEQYMPIQTQTIHRQFFHDRESALAWLRNF